MVVVGNNRYNRILDKLEQMKQYLTKICFWEKYGKNALIKKKEVPEIFIVRVITFHTYTEFTNQLNELYDTGFDFVKILERKDYGRNLGKDYTILLKKVG